MHRILQTLILAGLLAAGCASADDMTDVSQAGAPQNFTIRPFGDSITYGFGFASLCYQYPAAATGGGYRGWMTFLATTPPGVGFYFSTVGNQLLGSNYQQEQTNSAWHDGYPGWRTDQLAGIADIQLTEEPHVTLIHAGTNDILQQPGITGEDVWNKLETVLMKLRAKNPNTKLVVAQIIRLSDTEEHQEYNQTIDDYNHYIQINVTEQNFPNSSVVPMGGKTFLNSTDYIADGIHPDCTGYVKMACQWIEGIAGGAPPSPLCNNPTQLCSDLAPAESERQRMEPPENFLKRSSSSVPDDASYGCPASDAPGIRF